ncbi:MAG: Rossmann-like domain-containing protein [Thermodesulfobacteriota bacterium]
MKILNDLISSLDLNSKARDIRQGVFHTAVVTRSCGLAATLPRDALRQNPPLVNEPGLLLKKSVFQLARMAFSKSILEAAIGMATINSLLTIDEDRCIELNAQHLIAEKGAGKRIAIIGHFPFISALKEHAKEVWVIEKNPQQGDLSEDQARKIIPQADVVGVTGTSLTNHTFEDLRKLFSTGAYVVMLGDTTPLSPVLFDHGIHAISGTKVIDIEQVLACVSQGATYRQIKGIKRLTMIQ